MNASDLRRPIQVRRLALLTISAVSGLFIAVVAHWLPVGLHAWSIVLPYLLGVVVCMTSYLLTAELAIGGLCALAAFFGYAAFLLCASLFTGPVTGSLVQSIGAGLILTVLSTTFSAVLCTVAVWAIFDLSNLTLRRS